MTIRIQVSNDDDTRDIEVELVDPFQTQDSRSLAGAVTVGPKATAEFWVHTTQAVLVREAIK